MDGDFQSFLQTPENKVLVETYQRKQYLKSLRAQEKAAVAEFRDKVLDTDYDTQKALAPYLKIPALRAVIQTFLNDENGDIKKWACNPEVQHMFADAKRMLEEGRLTEKELHSRLTECLQAGLGSDASQIPHTTTLGMEDLVSALNEHLQERRLGNEGYRVRDFPRAEHHYIRAKAILSVVKGQGPEEQKELDSNMLQILLNFAALYLERQQYPNVVKACTEALEIDCGSCKALARRAKAYIKMHSLKAAAEDIALMDFLKDPEFALESKKLTNMVYKAKVEGGQKESDLYSKMLS